MSPYCLPGRSSRTLKILLLVLATAAAAHAQERPDLAGTIATSPLPQRLTLELAEEILLQSNPEILSARAQLATTRASEIDAGLYPNPTFVYDASNVGSDDGARAGFWDRQDLIVRIAQPILLGGKRGKRLAVAERGTAAAQADLQDVVRRQRFELQQRYYRVVLAKASLQLAREILQRFDEILRLSEVRYAGGDISGLELNRLRTERLRFSDDEIEARLQLELTRNALRQILGTRLDAEFDIAEDLQFEPVEADVSELLQLAMRARPELAASSARLEQAEHQRKLARAERVPDVTPFLGYNRDFGRNVWAFGLSIDLPLFDRNQGAIARAVAEMDRREHQRRGIVLAVRRQVRDAYSALQAQAERVRGLESDYVPSAGKARQIAEAAYRLGSLDLIAFLDAERSHRETVRAYYRALYEHQIAAFRLQAVVSSGRLP